MKDTDPLPYKYKYIYNKVVIMDNNINTYKLISESVDDLLYKIFVKPYIKVFRKYKSKKIR